MNLPTAGAAVAVADMVDAMRASRPSAVGTLVVEHAARLGLARARLWLVDLQHRLLVPIGSDGDPGDEGLSVEGSLAGRAYRTGEVLHTSGSGAPTTVWVPLLHRDHCLGVLGGQVGEWDPQLAADLLRFGGAAAAVITLHAPVTDVVLRTQRLRPASLAAEVQWSLLPPLSVTADRITVCGALEPAYDIGGDSLDYAVNERSAHLAVFDAKGHGLGAALLVSATVGAYRHARRTGRTLHQTYELIDAMVQRDFGPESFVTGVLAELDLDGGELSYLVAGHHPCLLLRGGSVVRHLTDRAMLPFGLAGVLSDRLGSPTQDEPARESLEPGDRVALFTDGVIEARDPTGDFFGLERLEEELVRADASTTPVPETLRRLVGSVLDHQADHLQDDATILLAEWHPRG